MKLAAANAIAASISDAELSPDYIIPSVFNRRVTTAVAQAVEQAATIPESRVANGTRFPTDFASNSTLTNAGVFCSDEAAAVLRR